MLLADPLSRLCAPSDGFYDVALPAKVYVLLENLPQQVAECKTMRVFANKDTAAVARMVQKWRKLTNPISQGKLGSFVEPKQRQDADDEQQALVMNPDASVLKAFSIGTPHANTGVRKIRELIASGKSFAVLTSISLIPQIARGVNESDMDEGIALKVNQMTKLVMAATADAWLISLPGMVRRHEIYSMEQQMQDEANVKELITSATDAHEHDKLESLSVSFSLFSKELQGGTVRHSNLSLVSTYLALAGRAQKVEASSCANKSIPRNNFYCCTRFGTTDKIKGSAEETGHWRR